jgi:hypothetical protein
MKTRFLVHLTMLVVVFILSACGASSGEIQETTVPAFTPPAGWNKFVGEGIEVWLPNSYQGGDLEKDLDVIVGRLETLGPEYEQIIQTIEANPSLFVLWAFDTSIGDTGFLTNMNITHEEVVSAVTLDMYIDAVKQQLPSSFTIADQKKIQLGENEAIQLEIDVNDTGISAKEAMFIIKDDNTIWVVTYSTGADEYANRLPVFEESANTIQINP